MNNFTIIYKILKALEAAMDSDTFDETTISPERLKISENRRNKLLIKLYKAGYIENVYIKTYVDEDFPSVTVLPKTTITIKGLEYLEENSLMKKSRKNHKRSKRTYFIK